MSSSTPSPALDRSLRDRIIEDPNAILEDPDLMRVLIAANERNMGANIVDLRGIAMERLEARLDRLEDTHRNVIAAAYENLAGTNQIHRAVLRMMEPVQFSDFLTHLKGDVADILRVDALRLILETATDEADPNVIRLSDVLGTGAPGFIQSYISGGRSDGAGPRQVTLRQLAQANAEVHGDKAPYIRSEACLRLDLGEGRLPGMLVLGAEDPHQFTPQQGTDLLTFFAGVFERIMRRWLA